MREMTPQPSLTPTVLILGHLNLSDCEMAWPGSWLLIIKQPRLLIFTAGQDSALNLNANLDLISLELMKSPGLAQL